MIQAGPTLRVSDHLHATKYRQPGEDFREAMNRIAATLKDNDDHYRAFREVLLDMRFLPAGRVQAAIGAPRHVTAFNCFVSGTIKDNFVDHDGIMERCKEGAQTMRMGGGMGFDFSPLRPRGELISTLQSRSSGPVSFMAIYDAMCKCVASAGHRRGAMMGVMRVDHPDAPEFVRAKQNSTNLTGFNISLAVTDEFMRAVASGGSIEQRWGRRRYGKIDARDFWEIIMRSTWDWAEPGVLFIDRINEWNNLRYCEEIAATNPCAEQPLPPYGACLLGSINLVKYVRDYRVGEIAEGVVPLTDRGFDFDQLEADLPIIVRAMDNVTDRTIYPLPQQREEAISKRRMGLGITGAANAAEALGFVYGSPAMRAFLGKVLQTLGYGAYVASAKLAEEKGSFPAFDVNRYLDSEHGGWAARKLPAHIKDMIRRFGLRNSHLTSIAPTGTISLCADNISSGIEPVFSYQYDRTIQAFEGPITERVTDYGVRVFGVKGRIANECSADDHLGVLEEAYKWVDSAVSKTCNVSPAMAWNDFKAIYRRAWEGGCKGCTTFNSGGRRFGVLVDVPESGEACYIDPETGAKDCA